MSSRAGPISMYVRVRGSVVVVDGSVGSLADRLEET